MGRPQLEFWEELLSSSLDLQLVDQLLLILIGLFLLRLTDVVLIIILKFYC